MQVPRQKHQDEAKAALKQQAEEEEQRCKKAKAAQRRFVKGQQGAKDKAN